MARSSFLPCHEFSELWPKGRATPSLVPLFVLALAMGTAYERTRRPWVPIVMHAGFNALNIAALGAM